MQSFTIDDTKVNLLALRGFRDSSHLRVVFGLGPLCGKLHLISHWSGCRAPTFAGIGISCAKTTAHSIASWWFFVKCHGQRASATLQLALPCPDDISMYIELTLTGMLSCG